MSSYFDMFKNAAAQAATAAGVPVGLFEGLIDQESAWNPNAISSAGAYGLTQLEPGTARQMGANMYDPSSNLAGGAKYLRSLFDKYGNWTDALGAYNAGPGRYDKYKAGNGTLPAETQAYIPAVLSKAANYGYSADTNTSTVANATTPQSGAASSGNPWVDGISGFLDQVDKITGINSAAIAGDAQQAGSLLGTIDQATSNPGTAVSTVVGAGANAVAGQFNQLLSNSYWKAAAPNIMAFAAIGALIIFGVYRVVKTEV